MLIMQIEAPAPKAAHLPMIGLMPIMVSYVYENCSRMIDSEQQENESISLKHNDTARQSTAQEVRRWSLLVLMKTLFDKKTHRRLPPPPTDAGTTVCIWKLGLSMEPSGSVRLCRAACSCFF